jgi:hypothetical protein
VNPISGAGRAAAYAALTGTILRSRGVKFEICHTKAQGHGEALAREAAGAGFRVVMAVGGDGTVNEVARGLIGATGTALRHHSLRFGKRPGAAPGRAACPEARSGASDICILSEDRRRIH